VFGTKIERAVRLFDLQLEFFADENRWLRGNFTDGWRRCLVDAVFHLSAEHLLPPGPVMYFLQEALPGRRIDLVKFNDRHCRSIAQLRAVILKGRSLASECIERDRAAEAVKRWLMVEVELERQARARAGDHRETYILCPRAPDELAINPPRLAA
jgi:hypothetical protein